MLWRRYDLAINFQLLWVPAAAIAQVVLISIDLRKRYATGHCQDCGYNLTGNVSGRCPECGKETKPKE